MAGETVIFVVDDDEAVRDSLSWLLESEGFGCEVFADASTLLHRLAGVADGSVGAVIADLRLPGLSGQDLVEEMREREIHLPVVMITGHGDVPAAVRAFKGGVIDFLQKPFGDRELLDRVRDALQVSENQQADHAAKAEVSRRYDKLTKREREVMERVVQGRLNKQIATELGLSHKTIEVHRAHVMEKMEADSLADLVRMSVTGKVAQPAGE